MLRASVGWEDWGRGGKREATTIDTCRGPEYDGLSCSSARRTHDSGIASHLSLPHPFDPTKSIQAARLAAMI